jgi:nitroimidazol reductase NimA-like FMN-containing flavoprotein (pyridoxamine 5'-phosphate oxidase superfamily)
VAFVYIFLDTFYIFGSKTGRVLKLLRKTNKLYLCDLFWDTILLEAKKSRI